VVGLNPPQHPSSWRGHRHNLFAGADRWHEIPIQRGIARFHQFAIMGERDGCVSVAHFKRARDGVWFAVPRQLKWRFDRKINRGFGISALFSGDSGTGKTMAAEVLAGALRPNLYRVDSENRVLATSLSLCINS
jgi:ATP-dependent Clp protease ATP-binding subunit ClpA